MLLKAVVGKELNIKPDIICAKERFGSNYCGWDIVTASIYKHSIIYSFGVGEDASFDISLIKKYNLTVHVI